MIATLQRRELLRVAGQLSEELGLPFAEARPGERIEGRLGRMIEMTSGRYALIEKSREFTLVPWRPVLERQIGKSVSGIMRDGGGISWTLGRQRGGPRSEEHKTELQSLMRISYAVVCLKKKNKHYQITHHHTYHYY